MIHSWPGKIMMSAIPFCLTIAGCHSNETSTLKKPNVIIILADDQGWGDLSLNGNTNLSTPNIDKLASQGARFTNFYVCPVCSPTRAELLTGRYAVRGGVYSTSSGGERLDLDETTIGDVFKNAGYATAAYGKWHNGMQYPYHPNGRGFDDFYGFCSGHWGDYFNPMLEHNGELVTGEGFIIDDLTNHGLAFIEKNKDKPFLLYLPFNTPHSPMQVPDEYWYRMKDKNLQMLANDANPEDIEFTRAALAMCENIDWNVGRVAEKISELGLEENTIILYFSDNGPNSWRWNGGMKGKKGSTDEGGVRSPLIVKWPGKIKQNLEIEEIAAAIDLLPTLVDLAGIEHTSNKPLDGISLKLLLTENQGKWNDRYIYSYWNKEISVRNQKYRLDSNEKLFDIEKDRGQTTDLSLKIAETEKQLLAAKEKFKTEILSELPLEDKRPFLFGDKNEKFTQIPAADGVPHGNIQRSNKWPNCSFFTNWTSLKDEITWDIEVVEEGDFHAKLYYTCPKEDVGSEVKLTIGNSSVKVKISEAFDPPLRGMENDRVLRDESYVKDWKTLELGIIHIKKGPTILKIKALEMPGQSVMDFGLLMFERK